MQDLIFGTLSTDDLKLIFHRTSHRGIQHGHQVEPIDPVAGEGVQLTVLVGADIQAENVACYYTSDGSEPAGSRGKARNGVAVPLERVEVGWDTLTWGYLTYWRCWLPPQPEGTRVRYRIGAWAGEGDEIFADWPDVVATVEEAARAHFQQEPTPHAPMGDPALGTTFHYHVDRLQPPQWAREALIYHIFVDRFHPGKGHVWKQTANLRDFFGGTLWGISEQLDYIAGLGATCLWLSPIFPSPTPHGYDATGYQDVASHLGGDEALRELVREAHGRGIRVVLDLVCNHLSNQHPIFQDALANPESRYRDWFFFDDPRIGYRAYFGVPGMPQLNLKNPQARGWMIDIARFWLREFDVDGFRLDHANGPGPSFWPDFWAACKGEKSDSFCFGEIVEPPEIQRRYVGRMDGTLDFHLADVIRQTYAYGTRQEDQFWHSVDRHLAYFSDDFLMLSFLDNHDMDRFLFIAGDDKNALRRAAGVQMRLPGPPIIYYGTEVGMSQALSKSSQVGLEVSRMPMLWGDDQDKDLLEYYKSIIRERFESKPWITHGRGSGLR